jgi:uncharacterized protein (TIGR02246 family)
LAQNYTSAWNTGSPDAVASCFAEDGQIIINAGEPSQGRAGIAAMAAGFFAEVPDLALACDEIRGAGEHAVYLWTFTGTHKAHGHPVRISGWEEWTFDAAGMIKFSRGWFDAADYARQAGV